MHTIIIYYECDEGGEMEERRRIPSALRIEENPRTSRTVGTIKRGLTLELIRARVCKSMYKVLCLL